MSRLERKLLIFIPALPFARINVSFKKQPIQFQITTVLPFNQKTILFKQ
jgi:hypothetical protein